MTIERTEKEIVFKLPKQMSDFDFEKIVKYLKYAEANSGNNFNKVEINQIAEASKSRWWSENKHRFVK